MIDSEGFRPNVGIILANDIGQVLWAKRIGHNAWQFPQGGIHFGETPEQALFRELREEVGLLPEHVQIIAQTADWLHYRLPLRYIRSDSDPVCIGQKQKWFLLKLVASTNNIKLNLNDPERRANCTPQQRAAQSERSWGDPVVAVRQVSGLGEFQSRKVKPDPLV